MFSNAVDTLSAVDSLKTAGGSDSGWILHHVMDSHTLDFEPFFLFNYHISNYLVLIFLLPNTFFSYG